MTKILIIDDDVKIQDLLAEYLGGYGYEISRCEDGSAAAEAAEKNSPDIILLDYMLPGKDGIEVLRDIRAKWATPVIMLTAKGDAADKIVCLELGADDYLAKPFNARELLARIKAVLRRQRSNEAEQEKTASTAAEAKISLGKMVLDPATMHIEFCGKRTELSKTEYRIMEVFMKNPNVVLSRDSIMNVAQGRDSMSFERSIDVHVSKLRSKLEDISGDKTMIKTIWGTGYMFVI